MTPLNNGSNLSRVAAKSVTGIGILKLKGAQAPLEERFFCAYLMVDCTGASSDAPFPLSGNANSVQSATLLIGINGGGLKPLSKVSIMSTPTSTDLQSAVESIDSLSQYGFSRISSIAKIAIVALESPTQNLKTPENIRNALSAIAGMADDIENCINAEAESVGCDHKELRHVHQWTPNGVLTSRAAS